MKNLFSLLVVLFCFLPGQNLGQNHSYTEIPATHLNHPELEKPLPDAEKTAALYELVHLRTQHSKTILNSNKTRTTIHSSRPLHFKDNRGYWLTLDYHLTELGTQIVFPSQQPLFEFSKANGSVAASINDRTRLVIGLDKRLVFADNAKSPLKTLSPNKVLAKIKAEDQLMVENGFAGIDIQYQFFHKAFKTNYIIKDAETVQDIFETLIIEETLELPQGYTLMHELVSDEITHRLLVLDSNKNVAMVFQQPVVSDAKPIQLKTRHLYQPYIANYHFEKISATQYKIQIMVDAQWLKSAERVFPVVIDPVITVESDEVVNSCFFPNYQQASIEVEIPEGETILWTDFEYDFVAVAGSSAWMEDQRSFISGPNGQTVVYSGSGNFDGTYYYQINNSEIGNGLSTGLVEYVFNFSRVWGGQGCNATFNFVNRRQVSVTYGTIVFGDGPIMVNEYSASNRLFLDSFGRTEDWIELYNADPENYFDLEGYYLSNNAQNPTMWQIRNGIIPPASRLVVFCSQRDISSGMVQHASFNLTQLRPDQIVLADPEGNIMEVHEMFTTQINHSYGRVQDGAEEWGVFASPTPRQPNSGAFLNYTSKPAIDLEPGHYQGSISIALSSTEDDEVIRYTTDGSTPTTASTLYTEPLTLSQTTVVRARAFSENEDILPGFIETRTYFIEESHTLPVFSFSGDADLQQLFDGDEFLRPIGHFEYFESNGDFIDGNLGDFNKHGNDSWNYDQRGVDFISRDDYGYKRRLEHKFFNTSDRTRFRRLMVKAAANDNYPFETGGAHIRDSYIQTLSQLAGLDLDERSSTNILVYVNGQYWGVYDLRERVDDNNFTDYYYGQDYTFRESDIYLQFLKTWQGTSAHFGNQPAINDWQSLVQYVQTNNMGDPAHFEYVESQLNINSLIDYFVINSHVVSRDWLNYNTGWWRGLNPAGQAREWRYILWDMEAALGHYQNFTGLPNVTATAPPCQAENLDVGDGHTSVIRKLIQENTDVRQKYVTRYADLLNTHLSNQRTIEVLDSMVAVIAPEMPRQIDRWGGNMTTWQNNVQAVRNFLNNRYNYLMNTGLASCYGVTGPYATTFNVVPEMSGKIRMNSEWLPNYPFNAQVFGNIETLLQAQPGPGYLFSHWEVDGAIVEPDENEASIQMVLTQASSITAHFMAPGTDGELIHYWHFNNLGGTVTEIESDYSLVGQGLITYPGTGDGYMDERTHRAEDPVSNYNLRMGQQPNQGAVLRARNPSDTRELWIAAPSTGFEDLYITFATTRTNNGATQQEFHYSADGGENWVLVEQAYEIPQLNPAADDFGYLHKVIDMSGFPEANDNPELFFKISFLGEGASNTSGNNRFDNLTVDGSPIASDLPVSALRIVSVNQGETVFVQEEFSLTVQAVNEEGVPTAAESDIEVGLSLAEGTGVLSGNLSATIEAGEMSVTIEGILYSTAQTGVRITASASGLEDGLSDAFDVLVRTYALTLVSEPAGAGSFAGAGEYAEGTQVVIAAFANQGFAFVHWTEAGDVISTQAAHAVTMPANDLELMAHFEPAGEVQLLHYWHFNTLSGTQTEVASDYSAVGQGLITYPGTGAGYMDERTHRAADPVSNFNLRMGEQPNQGAVLRVRNPSDTRQLLIAAPSNGFKDLLVTFATTRTSNGASQQEFHYSIDGGQNWLLFDQAYPIPALNPDASDFGYLHKVIDLSSFEDVNNNPDLYFRILFVGEGADNTSGNNRFDNFTVDGRPFDPNVSINQPDGLRPLMRVYPNPAPNSFNIEVDEPGMIIRIFNLKGQMVYQKQTENHSLTIQSGVLGSGLFIIQGVSLSGNRVEMVRLVIP